jgi:hypothetical protein
MRPAGGRAGPAALVSGAAVRRWCGWCVFRYGLGGWVSVGRLVLTWKPTTARRYFSERQGFERWFTVGRVRVRLFLRA